MRDYRFDRYSLVRTTEQSLFTSLLRDFCSHLSRPEYLPPYSFRKSSSTSLQNIPNTLPVSLGNETSPMWLITLARRFSLTYASTLATSALFHYRASSSLPSGVMLFNLYPFAPCDCNWIPYSLDNWIPCSLDNWIPYSLDNWMPCSLDNWILCSLDNWMPCSLDNWMPCSYDLRIPCSYDIRIGILGHFLY